MNIMCSWIGVEMYSFCVTCRDLNLIATAFVVLYGFYLLIIILKKESNLNMRKKNNLVALSMMWDLTTPFVSFS